MIRSLKTRRATITLATTALVVAAVLGSNPGMSARGTETMGKTPHSLSQVVPYFPNQPLTITIEHPFYNPDVYVQYAEIQNMEGVLLGYWLPNMTTAAPVTVTTKKGQTVQANRITVQFNTANWYPDPPTTTPLPMTMPSAPSVTSGAIIIIHTNVAWDAPPEVSITIQPLSALPM